MVAVSRRARRWPDDLADALGAAQVGERPVGPAALPARLGVDERPPQLGHEERVAAGQLAQRACDLALLGARIAIAGEIDELRDLLRAQTGEPHADHAFRAPQVGERGRQRLRDLRLGVAERREDEPVRVRCTAGEVAQEQQRRRIRPVGVLDDHDERGAPAHRGEQVGDRAVQPVALGVRVRRRRHRQPADALGQVREQARQLAAAFAEIGAKLGRIGNARELVERLDERAIRTLDHRVAGSVEDEGSRGVGLLGELADEAALARPGLAADEREAQPVAVGRRDEAPEGRQLPRASRERERGGQAERTWELVHDRRLVRSDHPRRAQVHGNDCPSGSGPVMPRRRGGRSVAP